MELVGQKILIVDDEPLFLQTTGQLLRKEGAECETAVDAHSGLKALERGDFDLILTDLNMPGNLRWELLKAGRERWSHVPMIVVTGVPTLPSAIESLRLGVTDYLLKPVGYPELLASIRRAIASHAIQRRLAGSSATTGGSNFHGEQDVLIGESPVMQDLKSMIERIASSDAHVLIVGDTGTGKELVARMIHRQSRRRDKVFQMVDCIAAETEPLAASLFGTAHPGQPPVMGLLERASEGCVFLSEVAELPAAFQPRLLRAVQSQVIVPLGSHASHSVDVRFVSATQRKMETEISAGRFRQDLYFRLGVLSVSIPTLRERGEDVLLLAEHFWKTAAPAQRALDLDEAARQALLEYHWPGNVRELRNVVLRAATFSVNGRVTLAHLPPEIVQKVKPGAVSEPSTVDLRAESHGDSRPVGLASAEGTLDEKRAEPTCWS